MTTPDSSRPVRVLFLCTHNAARSQIAEALLTRKGRGRFEVSSAGTEPATHLHPLTIVTLRRAGIEWEGRPKGIETVVGSQSWDLVITVCDKAREACPSLPGRPVTVALEHSGSRAEVEGDAHAREAAFWDALTFLGRRIDLLCALPDEKLSEFGLEAALREIGAASGAPRTMGA